MEKYLMNLRCIVLQISIVLCFSPPLLFSQKSFDTMQFVQHLKQNNFFIEQAAFNKNLQKIYIKNPTIIDSLKLDLALIYYRTALLDSCKNTVLSISGNCCNSENLNKRYLTVLLLNKEYDIAQTMVGGSSYANSFNRLYKRDMELALKLLKKTLDEKDTIYNLLSVSPPLFSIKNRYTNYPKYSPALAGIYSALIPGAGKLYIGNKNQALTAFIANVFLAAQAAESYFRAGITSPRFIITAGVFSVFYSGNIIGSVALAKKKKKDYYNELDDEIFNYYSADLNK